MNPHDDDIERVLGALRAVEPEEGMEARILQRLASRDEARAASPWRTRIAYALGAGVVLAAMALVVVHRTHAAVPVIEKAASPVETASDHSTVARSTLVRPTVAAPRIAPAVRIHLDAERPAAIKASSSEGGGALLTESFPAPPLPLTEQEMMLLRIAHRGETLEAELPTPLPLGTEVAALRAGADKFFEDPTTGENKWKQLVALQAAPN